VYIELHCASAFSFLESTLLPEVLVDRAAELGYPALALLDRDGVYGSPRFHKAATKAGIRPIIGAELTIDRSLTPDPPPSRLALRRGSPEFAAPRWIAANEGGRSLSFRLPVLIESQEGYRNLCRLITRMKLRSPKGEGALTLDELDGHTRGLVALVGRQALQGERHGVGGLIDRLVGLFGRQQLYLEIQRHFLRDEEADTHALLDLASAFHVPVVATNGVRFGDPAERGLCDVLTCIREKTDLAHAGRRLERNAERFLKPPAVMEGLFQDLPHAVTATRDLADRLQYTMADLGYRFPEYPVPDGETPSSFLRKIAQVGARDRYRPYHERAAAQIARELDLIEKLDLAGYFLIVWDVVNYCRQHDILVQGRGSAANSAVCYSLGITAVDPVGMDLLFERFLSEERGEWPDIDLDLPSGDRREQVIQHVYEKHGQLGAGMTANVITYRGRSAAREVGKALGLDAPMIDRLAKVMNQFEFVDRPGAPSARFPARWGASSHTLARDLSTVGFDLEDPRIRMFAELWHRIQDLPRHLGQHSGGMVMCQGRLDSVVPLENACMPGRVVVQWDKDDCADMGVIKIDLLGLGMMAVVQDAMEMINRDRSAPLVDLAHLPPDDPDVYDMLQRADTIGVFQVESRAQMATLPRLRPQRFYDIVVQVAIIRPGPIVGQMVHPYLNRRAGREPVAYPHPSLQPILERTLGVPLFQEQLLRMAMVAAGFTGGQAEELRRAFGFKRSERRMREVEVKLREGMARQGIPPEATDQIVQSITSFALYGFPESHAASFALLVYASAYLKAHFPAAFYAALLNNWPMGFYHPATLVKDAQRRGVRFASIDAQVSSWLCRIERDGTVRLGLRYVNGLREQVGRKIERIPDPRPPIPDPRICPKCGCDDARMIEVGPDGTCFCNTCAHDWRETTLCGFRLQAEVPDSGSAGLQACATQRFRSLEDFIAKTGVNRDELATLAEIGALNAFGHDRRSALWQIERAIRPAGELFDDQSTVDSLQSSVLVDSQPTTPDSRLPTPDESPLAPMTPVERMVADYAGTSLTIGPHPMTTRRHDLAMQGVLRAIDLPRARHGRRVRVAGTVITRQRPGTAKGFVFLTLEDETGIANIIVRPDLFQRERLKIVEEPFLLVEGVLQSQDGVTSVKAERVKRLPGVPIDVESRDFY
jgi:error-prone DNA polymerase